jgi:hypothetical protein
VLASGERHADDVQPAGEPGQGERADLINTGSEGLPVAVASVGGSECAGHGGEQLVQLGADLLC